MRRTLTLTADAPTLTLTDTASLSSRAALRVASDALLLALRTECDDTVARHLNMALGALASASHVAGCAR
jgi:hypothetical protein